MQGITFPNPILLNFSVDVKHISFYGIFLVLGLFVVWPTQAQEFRVGNVEASGTSFHRYVRPGEATVQVLVLGAGGGIYEVGAGTELDEFLALIGGAPSFGTRSSGARTKVTIQLYRELEGKRTLVYEAPMEQMVTEPGRYPPLQEGDVFVVETIEKGRIGWRDVLSIVTSISSIILLIERFASL